MAPDLRGEEDGFERKTYDNWGVEKRKLTLISDDCLNIRFSY